MVRRFSPGRVLVLVAVLLGSGWLASAASGYLYWSTCGFDTIGRANLDGTHANEAFVKDVKHPEGLALGPNGEYIYWAAGTGFIGRANLDGSGVNNYFTGPSNANNYVLGWVATDSAHLYWPEHWYNTSQINGGGDIARADLDATNGGWWVKVGPDPGSVATDNSHLFWVNSKDNAIGRMSSLGKHVNKRFITGTDKVTGLAVGVNHTYIYWSSRNGTIGRANLNGTHANDKFVMGADHPGGVAVDSAHIYWTNANSTIGRANLDGTDVNQKFITGAHFVCGLAVNSAGPQPGPAVALPSPVTTPAPVVTPPPSATKPSNTSLPTISGTAQDGSTLSTNNGTWSGSTPINYQYQWRLCGSLGGGCTDITGQTAQTYVLTAADVGNTLRVRVTAKNAAGSSLSVSAPTAKVSAAAGSTTTTATTTTTSATTATIITVTADTPQSFSFRLSALGTVVTSVSGRALTVPLGSVTFNVTNPVSNINSHDFEVCSTALTATAVKKPVLDLPNKCSGMTTPVLAPGGPTATLTIPFTTAGTYEYLSTVPGDASAGMKGELTVT